MLIKKNFKTIREKIKHLKQLRRAVILAHNYQLPEVQDAADFTGDSLELSRIASKTDAKIIVFCGVHFMAETASILSPEKTVIMPDISATCPMANMIRPLDIMELKAKHPTAVVVGYVNTSASIKAELDICCTSTNATNIIKSLGTKEVIFVPDKNLALFTSKQTGKKLISWDGFCPSHVKIKACDIEREKKFHPQAKVIVHPECLPEVLNLADEVLSTSKMQKFAGQTPAKEMIIGTEVGIIYRLKKDFPQKEFYPASEACVCPNMKRTTEEKILFALEEVRDEVRVPDSIRLRAIKSIKKMLEIS
jgi:quinolinate synthase